jgi:hypothetical protein
MYDVANTNSQTQFAVSAVIFSKYVRTASNS